MAVFTLVECIRIIERCGISVVGRVWGCQVLNGSGALDAEIEDTAFISQVEALVQSELFGPGIDRGRQHVRSAALFGIDLHDTGCNVSVFDRGDTRDDLDGFDVCRSDTAGVDTGHCGEVCIVGYAHSVDFDTRAETDGRTRLTVFPDSDLGTACRGERRVDGRSSREQACDVGDVDHLHVIHRCTVDGSACGHTVLVFAGGHHDVVDGQCTGFEVEDHVCHVTLDIHVELLGDVSQTGDGQFGSAFWNVFDCKFALVVCDGPQLAVRQVDDGHIDRILGLFVEHDARDGKFLCIGPTRQSQ